MFLKVLLLRQSFRLEFEIFEQVKIWATWFFQQSNQQQLATDSDNAERQARLSCTKKSGQILEPGRLQIPYIKTYRTPLAAGLGWRSKTAMPISDHHGQNLKLTRVRGTVSCSELW